MAVEEPKFQSLLEQIRELHELADELTTSKSGIHANVRARMRWERQPPSLPQKQRELADRAVEVLETPRLSPSQSRQLQRVFFGR